MSDKQSNIGLFLAGERGLVVLKALLDDGCAVTHAFVLKQEAHELNNKTEDIIALCEQNNILCETSDRIKPEDYSDYLQRCDVDIVFVVGWRYLINNDCFAIPAQGIFVLHDSLLPKNRGFAPTNWAIINEEKTSGVTLFYINEAVDAGDIVDQMSIDIAPDETATTLNEKITPLYPKIILNNLEAIINGTNKRIKQDHTQATYLKRRRPEDGRLNFNEPAKANWNLIRALSFPYPGAFFFYNDEKIIIWQAEIAGYTSNESPGMIIELNDDYGDVATSDGVLRVLQVAYAYASDKFLKLSSIVNTNAVLT